MSAPALPRCALGRLVPASVTSEFELFMLRRRIEVEPMIRAKRIAHFPAQFLRRETSDDRLAALLKQPPIRQPILRPFARCRLRKHLGHRAHDPPALKIVPHRDRHRSRGG